MGFSSTASPRLYKGSNYLTWLTIYFIFLTSITCNTANAHPPPFKNKKDSVAQTNNHPSLGLRSLSRCHDLLAAAGHEERAIERRSKLVNVLRDTLNMDDISGHDDEGRLLPRNFGQALSNSHHSNMTGLTFNSSDTALFPGNASCVLLPEVFVGPFCERGIVTAGRHLLSLTICVI